uniref:Uncharacterized protein n=1 Tax=Timema cristinae TaxID=61476 RepID=A0A7R9H029_TIMCR|nr:unnamed protein product [Timema cristinae]
MAHFSLVQSECRDALLTHWLSLDPLANLGFQVPASLAGFYFDAREWKALEQVCFKARRAYTSTPTKNEKKKRKRYKTRKGEMKSETKAEIIDQDDNVLLIAKRENGLYFPELTDQECRKISGLDDAAITPRKNSIEVWHSRMGHLNVKSLQEEGITDRTSQKTPPRFYAMANHVVKNDFVFLSEVPVARAMTSHGRFANADSIIFKHMVSQTSNQPPYSFNNDGSENVGMSNQEYPTYENSGLMNGQYTGEGDINVSSHYRHCYRTSPGGYIVDNDARHTPDHNELYRQTSYNSVEQLEVLYSVRVREVQRLTQQLEEFSNEAAKEREEMFSKLAFWEAEQERAKSLHKVAEQQLCGKQTALCVPADIPVSWVGLAIPHNVSGGKQTALCVPADIVESQFCQLEQRVCELIRAQEALQVEKGETINHLSRSLEESQRQCQHLMSSAASQETIGLKLQLSTTRQEKDELSKKVHTLTKEVESLRFDLNQYENATHLGLINGEDPLSTDSVINLGIGKMSSSGDGTKITKNDQSNLTAQLRDEYYRSLIAIKFRPLSSVDRSSVPSMERLLVPPRCDVLRRCAIQCAVCGMSTCSTSVRCSSSVCHSACCVWNVYLFHLGAMFFVGVPFSVLCVERLLVPPQCDVLHRCAIQYIGVPFSVLCVECLLVPPRCDVLHRCAIFFIGVPFCVPSMERLLVPPRCDVLHWCAIQCAVCGMSTCSTSVRCSSLVCHFLHWCAILCAIYGTSTCSTPVRCSSLVCHSVCCVWNVYLFHHSAMFFIGVPFSVLCVEHLLVPPHCDQDATNFLTQLSKQEEFSKQMENLSKENRNLCERLEQSGGELSKLTTQLEDVRKERGVVEMENEQLKERIHELVQTLDNEKVSTIEQYNKEYFKFHDEALTRVRQEKHEQAEAQVIDLRMQLEQAGKECEEVKRLYIDICGSKEKLTHQLELEQKAVNNLSSQLNTETDKLNKVLKELKEGQEASRTLEEQLKSEQELVKHLKDSLETERINSEELRSRIKELEKEKDEATKNANERARLLYTSKVNEEIDKAKREALIELENDCQKRQEQHSSQVSEIQSFTTGVAAVSPIITQQ